MAANPSIALAEQNQEFPNDLAYHPQKANLAQQRVSLGCFENGRSLL
ncbi:hypothetical protein Q5692_37510 [Microcoleus sp. C2C3]